MKIRQGFVSNSSSSSYIIGIAAVKDVEKCKTYMADNKIANEATLSTFKELKEAKSWPVTVREGKSIEMESFNGAAISISAEDFKDDDYVLTYCFFGNEGDSYFYDRKDDDDDWLDLNYDKVYNDNFFNKTEKDVMVMFDNSDEAGLDEKRTQWIIGASRNG